MNIAIVDDDPIYIKDIERLLYQISDIMGDNSFVDSFTSGKDLLQSFADMVYDIVFLDIEMDFDGIKTARGIRNLFNDQQVKIIFISGYENYFKELYELKPVGFVSKPIQKEEFVAAVKRCVLQFHYDRNENSIFEYKVQTVIKRVLQRDILYLESKKRKMRIVFDESNDEFYSTVNRVFEDLREDVFLQVHESYIVNLDKIQEFHPNMVKMRNGDEINIGKSHNYEVKKKIKQYLGWRNR